ncbi:MAG: hypothetical protein AAB651_01675 [Patescibacteria group bacterium]
MIDLNRWQKLSKRDQLGHIASEIKRAAMNQDKDSAIFLQMLERALFLTELSLDDPKWKDNPLSMLILKDELAKAYIGENKNLDKLYAAL